MMVYVIMDGSERLIEVVLYALLPVKIVLCVYGRTIDGDSF